MENQTTPDNMSKKHKQKQLVSKPRPAITKQNELKPSKPAITATATTEGIKEFAERFNKKK